MKVSIVIPTRNASAHIAECLGQIQVQDYPVDLMEVVVADGGSGDDTIDIVSAISRNSVVPIRIIPVNTAGRSEGLNAAIRAATGEAICRLDVRSRIATSYISQCVKTLKGTGAANVGGVQMPIGTSATQVAIGLAMAHPFGVGNAHFRLGTRSGYVDTVYLGFFRREVFDVVGLFDESAAVISEDSDMNQRIRARGMSIYLDCTIKVGYYPRETFAQQMQLYFRYGGARAGNVLKSGTVTSWRQLAAPALVAVLITLAFAGVFLPAAAFALIALFGLYITAAGIFGLIAALRAGRPELWWRVCVAFGCMHFGWGTGFWCRLLTPSAKAERWGG